MFFCSYNSLYWALMMSAPCDTIDISYAALQGFERIPCSHLFTDHVDRVLDTAVRDDRHDRGISNAEVLDAMDPQLVINDTLLDVLAQTGSTTRI